jgi:hypothetical protein
MEAIVKQPPFHVCLLSKLNLIRKIYRTNRRSAKAIGISHPRFRAWRSRRGSVRSVNLEKVDAAYDVAWERYQVQLRKLERARNRRAERKNFVDHV